MILSLNRSSFGSDLLGNSAKNPKNPQLEGQILEQVKLLFPNRITLPEDDNQEEQITGRIVYEMESECSANETQSLG